MKPELSNLSRSAEVSWLDAHRGKLTDFLRERNEALASLDETRIRNFFRKWNSKEMPSNLIVFWGSVHKAITGSTDLPFDLRLKSKQWLDERGFQSLDDGDLCASNETELSHRWRERAWQTRGTGS